MFLSCRFGVQWEIHCAILWKKFCHSRLSYLFPTFAWRKSSGSCRSSRNNVTGLKLSSYNYHRLRDKSLQHSNRISWCHYLPMLFWQLMVGTPTLRLLVGAIISSPTSGSRLLRFSDILWSKTSLYLLYNLFSFTFLKKYRHSFYRIPFFHERYNIRNNRKQILNIYFLSETDCWTYYCSILISLFSSISVLSSSVIYMLNISPSGVPTLPWVHCFGCWQWL